jgi:oxepin-CoA hydrolase/3-oxo-5,6-dehydrosuberyl-CoA semialdehyde dehydrogenase
MTTKAGQKCTAVRRIIVPQALVEDVQIALGKRLASTIIGDPNVEGVRMGSLAGAAQLKEVTEKVLELAKTQEIVFGDSGYLWINFYNIDLHARQQFNQRIW